MKIMSTIKFPGDTEAREIVDAKTRQALGTADISSIGDGTVTGAILALVEMIKSGGGGAEAITIEVGNEASYTDAETYDLGEDGEIPKVSDIVPTEEQLQNCRVVCRYEGNEYEFTNPNIYHDAEYNEYNLDFNAMNGTDYDCYTSGLVVSGGSENVTPGVYLHFYEFEQGIAGVIGVEEAPLDSATIYFPKV